jgi:serine/threonine protein kinase
MQATMEHAFQVGYLPLRQWLHDAGTVAYMAPEVLQTGNLSLAADVYSFAMIMLELWSGEAIYKDFPAHQVRHVF